MLPFMLVPPPPAITDGEIEKLPPDCSGAPTAGRTLTAAFAGNAPRHDSPATPSTGLPINEGTKATKKTIPISRKPFRNPGKLDERGTAFINPP
jgi:hypothetical protein